MVKNTLLTSRIPRMALRICVLCRVQGAQGTTCGIGANRAKGKARDTGRVEAWFTSAVGMSADRKISTVATLKKSTQPKLCA